MTEKLNTDSEGNGRTETREATSDANKSGIGAGRKIGVYGCGFLILAVVIIVLVLIFTGIYNPFQGTEGVGP